MPASQEAASGGPLDGIREVLAEAGLTEEQITRLAEEGVLTGDRAGPERRAPAG